VNKILKLSLLALALVLSTSPRAHAFENGGPVHGIPNNPPPTAPEVDPSLAFGGLTLLAGTLTVMRSRRQN
jgi:hypothetical protein